MFSLFLPPFVRGLLTFFFMILITVLMGIMVYILAVFKYFIPVEWWQNRLNCALNMIPVMWTDLNTLIMRLLTRLDIKLIGAEKLSKKDWYLMTSNHQTWTDVVLLYRVFNHRLPVLKFFMKSQLLWVPVIGSSCWLIGYPFMKRYSKAQLAKNPKLKGKDLATTKKMCERFKKAPITIMSFAEGTRYTSEKAKRQRTPFKHLLKPRAGGLAYTLMAMDDCLNQFIDVTIVYPGEHYRFWDYLCGKIKQVIIKVDVYPITEQIKGDYINDRDHRVRFQNWLNQLWEKKDQEIDNLLKQDQ